MSTVIRQHLTDNEALSGHCAKPAKGTAMQRQSYMPKTLGRPMTVLYHISGLFDLRVRHDAPLRGLLLLALQLLAWIDADRSASLLALG